jgi:hypothetical protein
MQGTTEIKDRKHPRSDMTYLGEDGAELGQLLRDLRVAGLVRRAELRAYADSERG